MTVFDCVYLPHSRSTDEPGFIILNVKEKVFTASFLKRPKNQSKQNNNVSIGRLPAGLSHCGVSAVPAIGGPSGTCY